MTREQIGGLLARTPAAAVIELADAIVGELDDRSRIQITRPPAVGTVQVQVQEPLAGERFILADALACNVEVLLDDQPGFAMRLGEDTLAVTAQAICEAEYAAGGRHAQRVHSLCHDTAEALRADRAAEWDALRPTIVEFEEVQ